MNDFIIGQVVRSNAGRDKGQFMVVVEVVDENFTLVCNGKLRKVNNPKKKKIKHLAKTNHIVIEIQEKILNGKKITNAEIRKILESYRTPEGVGNKNREEV
ncbi:KOW domain-containing RNA-binding protein [Acetobacterium sp.]|uniref:KOW domain-containing RNA-binding protein n=1 Tax=Acetobacterium sp. TaxID=1872094 RepID=UPI002F416E27